jgi:hypothetical protein
MNNKSASDDFASTKILLLICGMKKSYFILTFLTSFLLLNGCQNANQTKAGVENKVSANTVVQKVPTKQFIKSIGVMAIPPLDHVKAASKNVFRMYSPDGLYEYFCTWETQETPDRMKRAFIAGTDIGNGMFNRVMGETIPINATAESFNYGVYLFENAQQILSGFEIHDWSSSRGILVITVMSTIENAGTLKEKAMQFYENVEILSEEKLAETRARIKQERETIGRNEEEQMYYSKVADHTLLNIQLYGGNPPKRSEQRFELCNGGTGVYQLKSGGGQNVSDETVTGNWDIVEDDDGVMLLVIKSNTTADDKWAIGLHKSGNVTIGGVEFILHAKGSPEGPGTCE